MEIVIRGDTVDELRENILAIAESYQVPRKINPKSGGKYGYHDIYAEEYKKIYDSMSCKDGIPLRESGYQLKKDERIEVVKLAHANAKPIWEEVKNGKDTE
tara:strand:+ start:1889 stop:2191 length:303 start_codon:yes stop_codon:yes gene_type:complete